MRTVFLLFAVLIIGLGLLLAPVPTQHKSLSLIRCLETQSVAALMACVPDGLHDLLWKETAVVELRDFAI
jgi:hypothetical protein